jgi:hypothetical protein
MTNLKKILTNWNEFNNEIQQNEEIINFIKNVPSGNIFNDIYEIYNQKDILYLEKVKQLFYQTEKMEDEHKILILRNYMDFLKISLKLMKPPKSESDITYKVILLDRNECTNFACYCFNDLFYGTCYIKLILRKSLVVTKSSFNLTYAEKLIREKLIPFLLYIPGDTWNNKYWKENIQKVHDVIYLLLNDTKTHNMMCKFLEKDLISATSFERKMINEMTVSIDQNKLTLYYNLITVLMNLWKYYLGNSELDYITKLMQISMNYPKMNSCNITYSSLIKYEDKNKENKQYIEFPEKCFYMLHRLIENIYLTTQNKYSIINNELESLKSYLVKLEAEQAKNFEPQREFQISIIMEKIARITPHYYTLIDYLTTNNIKNELAQFYDITALWIVYNIDNAYVIDESYIPIMENIIDNFSEFMYQNIKTLSILVDNTVLANKTIIGNKKYVRNPFIKIRCADNIFNFIFKNEQGLQYVFYNTFKHNVINSLVSFYVELEFNDSNLYHYKFGTRFHILHLIHFLKDMDLQYTNDLIQLNITNPKLYNRFLYILLSDFNYLLNEGLGNIKQIKKMETQINCQQEPEPQQNIEPAEEPSNNINNTNEEQNEEQNELNEIAQEINITPGMLQELLQNMVQDMSYDNDDANDDIGDNMDDDNDNDDMDDDNDDMGDDMDYDNDEEVQEISINQDQVSNLQDALVNMVNINGQLGLQQESFVDSIRRINRLTIICNNDFNYIDELFQLFDLLLQKNRESFLTEDICNHLIEILNYYLLKLSKQESDNLEEDIEKYNYNPYKILKGISYLYAVLSTETIFLELMVKNIYSFSQENIEIMIKKLSDKNMISQEHANKLYLMLDQIQNIKKLETLSIFDKLAEEDKLPTDFCDPVFYIPIKNPVALPTSYYIMEENVVKRHLISNHFDPINRQPLTSEKLEEYNKSSEAKEKVNNFIKLRDEWLVKYLENNNQ